MRGRIFLDTYFYPTLEWQGNVYGCMSVFSNVIFTA